MYGPVLQGSSRHSREGGNPLTLVSKNTLSPPTPACPDTSPSTPTPTIPSIYKNPSKDDKTSAGVNSPNAYHSVVLNGALVHIRQAEDRLHYQSTPDADLSGLLRSYFRLDDNLDAIYTEISTRDDHIARLIQKYPGVRLMRTPDPWECLVSYICSARAAPPRITQRVETIATQLGHPLTLDGETRHAFPDPQTVLTAGLDGLQQIPLGFQRVPHAIIQAAKLIHDGHLDLHRLAQPDIPYDEVISQLTGLYCVGPKIANCIALFALNKTEAFPVDSRVRNTVKRFHPSHTHSTDTDILTWAQDLFGPHAGYANQFLYMA